MWDLIVSVPDHCLSFYFDQMHIGKFYHISCNTVLCILFNSVNPLYVYISTNIIIIL